MASGILVGDECFTEFQEFKIRNKYKWVMYRISDDVKEIIIDNHEPETLTVDEKKSMSEETARARFKEFVDRVLETDTPKYCIVDVNCWKDEPNGGKRAVTKIALLNWCSDALSIKKKMIFASSKDALKKKLTEGYKELQINDQSEVGLR
ncbi:uncharacterized protein [Amphiura filiformis]|uniref:uncharacterized protein isoform X1 n=1 Tax=Amphiura filiformis TaxID=82378 RepID=UPI003B22316E